MDDDRDDTWTGINLFAAFPPASTVAVTRRNPLETILGVCAAIFVFLPVAWTWWSLHDATAAYDALLNDPNGAENGRTFLALWIRGFDGHLDNSWHRLVPTALGSLILIGVAVLMIVFHRIAAHWNVAAEEGAHVSAEADLLAALTSAQRHLNERRFDDPTHIDAHIKRSVERLRQAHEDTQNSTAELEKATKSLAAALSPLLTEATGAAKDVRAAAAGAQQAQTALGSAVNDLGSALTTTQSELDQSLQTLGKAVGGHTQTLGTAIGKHTKDLSDGTTQALGALSGNVAAAAVSQQAFGDEIKAFAAAGATANDQMSNLMTQVRDLIKQVNDSVRKLDETLHDHDSAIQSQASLLMAERDAAERLLRRLELIVDSGVPAEARRAS